MLDEDIDFVRMLETDLDEVLISICGLDKLLDNGLMVRIKKKYRNLTDRCMVNTD